MACPLGKLQPDGRVDLRQPRLFTDLVGKVHEQRTRRCHYQQACQERDAQPELRGMGGPWWGAGRTLINSIDPGTAFRVSFPLSGEQQERRDLFRSPSVQA